MIKDKKILVTQDFQKAFNKISSVAGIPIQSIKLEPSGMGYYRVFFYDEKTEFIVYVSD